MDSPANGALTGWLVVPDPTDWGDVLLGKEEQVRTVLKPSIGRQTVGRDVAVHGCCGCANRCRCKCGNHRRRPDRCFAAAPSIFPAATDEQKREEKVKEFFHGKNLLRQEDGDGMLCTKHIEKNR
jgi:hypothetical protein